MAINPADLTRPFDPTGRASTNLITGDQQVLSGVNFRDIYTVVPRLAPFFADSLQVSFRAQSGDTRPLVKGIDYQCSHWFVSASRACAKPIYGSITILNLSLVGIVTLSYQTIGGVWTTDYTTIAQILADHLHNPRSTAWEEVVNLPYRFPVIDHEWDLTDMVGASAIVTAIQAIEAAVRANSTSAITQHLSATNNPHHVTAAQIGTYDQATLDQRFASIELRLNTAGIP